MAEIDWDNVCEKYEFVPVCTPQKRMEIEAVHEIPDAFGVGDNYVVKILGGGSVFLTKHGTSLQYGNSHVFIRPKMEKRYIVYDWDTDECLDFYDRNSAEEYKARCGSRQIVEVTRE